jgi:PTS system mannose-specific IIB component
MSIVLTRIDDRLIHGQVMTAWVRHTKANRIIIVDDGVAKDPFLQKVMKMAAPSDIKVDVYTIEEGTEALLKKFDDKENVIILVKNPKTVASLIEGGAPIQKIVVGGMAASAGRKKFYKNISASEEEKEIFKTLLEKEVDIHIQIVPDNKPIAIKNLL